MAERLFAISTKLEGAGAVMTDLQTNKQVEKSTITITPVNEKWIVFHYYNDIPVVALADGADVSYEYGSDEPDWTTLVEVTDGDSTTGITLAVDSTLADMDTVGTFIVSYVATDSSGNVSDTLNVTITITDSVAPVITDSVGDTSYVTGTDEPDWTVGVTATDAYDGDITSSIVVDDSNVDMDTVGTFDVTYDVDDSSENSATTVTRTITITAE